MPHVNIYDVLPENVFYKVLFMKSANNCNIYVIYLLLILITEILVYTNLLIN